MSISNDVIVAAAAALGAAALTCLVQWLLRPVAAGLDLLDHPAGRKDHEHPTPVTGGLAMVLAVAVVSLFLPDFFSHTLLGFLLGAGLVVVVGLLDDKYDLPWWLRICAQAAAALAMVYIGGVQVERLGPVFGFGDGALGMLAVPFTVFATVGLINAVNMIDGADGLAGSLVLTALVMLTAAALYAGNASLALRLALLGGAVAGFLAFNMRLPWRPRAHLFMGNAGSAFLGYVIAWAAFRLTQNPNHDVSPVLALWLLPVPVMDTLVLMVRRLRAGRSPFAADRNHIHHLMLDAGIGPTRAALLLSLFSAVCGLLAAESQRALDLPEPLLLLAFAALCVGWFWMTRKRERAVAWLRRFKLPWLWGEAPAAPVDKPAPDSRPTDPVAADKEAG